MITDTTFFTNEPGYALLDRFKKTLKLIESRFPESALLIVNKSLVREGKKVTVHGLKLEIGKQKFGRDETSYVMQLCRVHFMHQCCAQNAPYMLGKSLRRKGLSESNATEYKAMVEKLGPKLNAFINSTKA